ncbi:enoyl-CoA hydratase/isomerase family protein [Aureliella helgolandensis]|uniref:Putative enoyl-CoA hydratase echA8 n=1 Tax=Aureliella helgolandensis TaxID=2527968 RepID=A0A518G9U2_9BACT|nr:enoyl-CoA hydratase/isomerase family protein [Aureliella helgolandensis]QDV25364.1 putative enoyl-CoA hydratase echA8 [Aureliella helgolandensis]
MITVKVNGSTGTIILDRASRCNALTRKMIEQLSQALDDLRQEKKVRGIVLSGAGVHFCTGLDLQELHETTMQRDALATWHQDAISLQSLLEQILQLPKPVVAAVDGAAQASGLALALACDLVVASHRATFSVPAPQLGLVAGLVIPLLQFRLGAATTSRLALGGDELSAEEAKNLGLVHHVVESDKIWVRSSNWIDSIAAGAAESVQLSKRVLNEMIGEQLSTMLTSGAAAMATALTTEAATEGLTAFAEKRAPKFP